MPLGFAHLGDSLVTGGNTSWPVGVDREVLGTGRGLPWNQLKAVTQPGETPETGVGASMSDKQLGHVRAAAGGGSRWHTALVPSVPRGSVQPGGFLPQSQALSQQRGFFLFV